jgi:hypothetical protein
MTGGQLSIVIDDQRGEAIALTGPATWKSTALPQWFNGTVQSPDFALNNSGQFGILQMKFQGICPTVYSRMALIFGPQEPLLLSLVSLRLSFPALRI